MKEPQLIGEILLQQQLITELDLDKGLKIQQQIGGRIGSILVRSGTLSENKLLAALNQQLDIPRLDHEEVPPSTQQLLDLTEEFDLSVDWQLDQKVLIWRKEDDSLLYCAKELFSDSLADALSILIGKENTISPVLTSSQQLDKLLHQLESSSDRDFDILDADDDS